MTVRTSQSLSGRAWRHGIRVGTLKDIYARQGGQCYLCKVPLSADLAGAAVDHDHSCCEAPPGCGKCVRGIACPRCNILIGLAKDDPGLLRRIADNFEAAVAEMRRPPGRACPTCIEPLNQCGCLAS